MSDNNYLEEGKFDYDDYFYTAERAATGRASCREFRCREKIKKNELRIAVDTVSYAPNGDGYGNRGWYHPECCFKTFTYRKHANPSITSIKQIQGIADLSPEDIQVFEDLISPTKKRKADNTNNEDDDGGSEKKKKRSRTDTAFREQLNTDYAIFLHSKQAGGEENEGQSGASPPDWDEKHTQAVLLYGQFHKMKADELKDNLRWNRQVMKGTKAIVLHKVIDGHLNGRLACCPADGDKLKFTDDCTAVVCSGHWDEDNMVHVPCSNPKQYSVEDAPRAHPWFTQKPTDEENAQLDKLEAIARGEGDLYATVGDDSPLGQLMKKANDTFGDGDQKQQLDFVNTRNIKSSTQKMIAFLQENDAAHIPPKSDDEVENKKLLETIGRELVSAGKSAANNYDGGDDSKTTMQGELVKQVVIAFRKKAKEEKVAAAKASRTYIDCPFKDKDQVKALGAKWDFEKRKWYVPGDKDIGKFSTWLPKEEEDKKQSHQKKKG